MKFWIINFLIVCAGSCLLYVCAPPALDYFLKSLKYVVGLVFGIIFLLFGLLRSADRAEDFFKKIKKCENKNLK